MKKSTLTLAILLTLNGCAETNQAKNPLALVLTELGKKIKLTDNEAETKPSAQNTEVAKATEIASSKTITLTPPAEIESTPKPVALDLSVPKESQPEAIKKPIEEPKTVEITPPTSQKIVLPKAANLAPVVERISLTELYGHHWQISKILVPSNFKPHDDHWLFSFDKTGKYKAFGACNYLTGKFNAANDGTFRLGKLETSLNDCPESKDEEVMMFNMLLMADSFAMQGETLVLKSADKVMIAFNTSEQEINLKMPQKSHLKKDKKALKGKKASKTNASKVKASKKKSQKNSQPNVSKPGAQKKSHTKKK